MQIVFANIGGMASFVIYYFGCDYIVINSNCDSQYVLITLYGCFLHNCFTGLECSDHGHLLNLFVRFLLTEEAQKLIMGKHEVPVATVPVTLLPVTKRVPLTNYVAALPL